MSAIKFYIMTKPLDRDCYIYWGVLSILLLARASCRSEWQHSKPVRRMFFLGGGRELGVAASCSGERVTLSYFSCRP